MKGVILAGGTGSRLNPLTKVTNKHLLPVYDKPMIYYPLWTLVQAGIRDIRIVSGKGHVGHFLELLGSGRDLGVNLSYEVQEEAGGIAQALGLCREFVGIDDVAVILGDNIFEDNVREHVRTFNGGAHIFLKEVRDAHRFGVAELDVDCKVISIKEKPAAPKSNLAVTGLYIYDSSVFHAIDGLEYSERGELEITDVNNMYLRHRTLNATILKGEWSDAGTFESLFHASEIIRNRRLCK